MTVSVHWYKMLGECLSHSQWELSKTGEQAIIFGMPENVLLSIRGEIENESIAHHGEGRLILEKGAIVPFSLKRIGYPKNMHVVFDSTGRLRANMPTNDTIA